MSGRSPASNGMQFSLFETRPLFEEDTLRRARSEWDRITIVDFHSKSESAQSFINQVQLRDRKKLKEEALEQEFNKAFFADLLDFRLYPGSRDGWTAWPKPPISQTRLSGIPDLLLGRFSDDAFEPTVVVELKKPTISLDAPQGSYGGVTPVEQAFNYARRLGSCRWVCVSNMHILRLYSIENSSSFYEIDLWATATRKSALKDLWHLLSFDSIALNPEDSPTWRLLVSSQNSQVAFQEGFYQIYTDIRRDILDSLSLAKPELSRVDLVQSAQRLLDRLLFIYFCEDHPDRLLRRSLVKDVVEGAVRLPGASRTKAYDALKALSTTSTLALTQNSGRSLATMASCSSITMYLTRFHSLMRCRVKRIIGHLEIGHFDVRCKGLTDFIFSISGRS